MLRRVFPKLAPFLLIVTVFSLTGGSAQAQPQGPAPRPMPRPPVVVPIRPEPQPWPQPAPTTNEARYRLGVYTSVVNVWQQADGGWFGWGPGLWITQTVPNSAAWGTFDPGDVIVRVNNVRVRSQDDLTALLQNATSADEGVLITFRNVRTSYIETRRFPLQFF